MRSEALNPAEVPVSLPDPPGANWGIKAGLKKLGKNFGYGSDRFTITTAVMMVVLKLGGSMLIFLIVVAQIFAAWGDAHALAHALADALTRTHPHAPAHTRTRTRTRTR